MATLTPEQILFFQEQGYALSHQPLFAPEKFAELQAIFEEQLALKGAKLSDELDTPHFRNERLLTFLLSDEVLDLVEPLIGPNIALWSSHFICKDPYTGRATPWHEDSAFWKGRCSAYDKIVTVWLAIDRSTRENGCMQVIPATHLAGGFSEYVDADTAQNTFADAALWLYHALLIDGHSYLPRKEPGSPDLAGSWARPGGEQLRDDVNAAALLRKRKVST